LAIYRQTLRTNKSEKIFGRNAQLAVLEYLIKNCTTTTYLSGIAEETGLSHSSVARVIKPLLKMNIVKEGKVGKQSTTLLISSVIRLAL